MSYTNPTDILAEELSDLLAGHGDAYSAESILVILTREEIEEYLERARGDNGKEEQELIRKELHQMAQNI